jgi:hypothetical protein
VTVVRTLRVVVGGSKAGLRLSGRRGPPELLAVGVDRKMKILIAYDGSDSADAGLADLRRAGLPSTAEALVVVTDIWLTSSPAEFSRAVARRRMLSAETSSLALLRRASSWGADLLVIGSGCRPFRPRCSIAEERDES